MSKATPEQLKELWVLLLNAYLQEMQREDGPTAEMLNGLRLFLKDNGINKNVGEYLGEKGSLEMLQDLSLPFQ